MKKTYLEIGDNTIIREFVTLNRGTAFHKKTVIGSECLIMAYAHVAHDCSIADNVIIANAVQMGGHVEIQPHASIGGATVIHQFVKIGDYAYIGGKSAVAKDIPPYVIASGDRASLHGLNKIGLKRHGFGDNTLKALKKAYRIIFRIGITTKEALQRVQAEVEQVPEVMNLIEFIKSSERGITR